MWEEISWVKVFGGAAAALTLLDYGIYGITVILRKEITISKPMWLVLLTRRCLDAGEKAIARYVPTPITRRILWVLRDTTQPSRSTWMIWFALAFLSAILYEEVGAQETLWSAIGMAVGTLGVVILSIPFGVGGVKPVDVAAFVGAIVGVVIWLRLGSALYGLLALLAADFMGAIPTMTKLWRRPGEEAWLPWTVTVASNVLNVFALDFLALGEWEFSVASFPLYMLTMNGAILFLILRPKLGLFHGIVPEGRT